ncbi:hypothetical protein U9M48_003364 [Paspalum notatum var. saurae]|uniref:Reverse transcriptase Ty1/copia-type domain-containing protein n=1 Tax=Paspalum notatum var. saurae TaxID=547442 RepID=A0AAQ3PQY4_PASNO
MADHQLDGEERLSSWSSGGDHLLLAAARFHQPCRLLTTAGFVDPAAPDNACLVVEVFVWIEAGSSHVVPALCLIHPQHRLHRIGIRQEGCLLLLLYVDDIIFSASPPALHQHIMVLLHSEFVMTDLGALHHFLGISVSRSSDGMFLFQRQYAENLLQRASMA